ncbi:MAG: hypothetical protein P4M08_10020 [Oligoflexia bacterium]|nr:hypothetical protein [Oligoflexia bacterium]
MSDQTKGQELTTKQLLKKSLKLLLYRLASECEAPSQELETILQDTISELYYEAKSALAQHEEKRRQHLRLVRVDDAAAASGAG